MLQSVTDLYVDYYQGKVVIFPVTREGIAGTPRFVLYFSRLYFKEQSRDILR